MIKVAADTWRNKLKEISLVWPKRSASSPLGTERISENARGIEMMILAMRIGNPYSSIRIGRRARGRLV